MTQLTTAAAAAKTDDEARAITSQVASLVRQYRIEHGVGLPRGPVEQASSFDPGFVVRSHTQFLSNRISTASHRVEAGESQYLAVSLPPRAGKSTLISMHSVLWLLRRHPEWKIVLTSHDGSLATGWARTVRTWIESHPQLGVALKPDGGAASQWETLEHGGVLARSVRSGLTGRGAKVMVIDDPIGDFAEAHSQLSRQALWDWWLSVAQTRFEPPVLVLVVMTRWHEDDFVGRLFSTDYEGDPEEWQRISIPAIAVENDVLGRKPGEPLLSPLLRETPEQALARWESVRRQVGTYTFSSMYQQSPAPAKGAIFETSWWRYWTRNEAKATVDGRVVYLDPASLTGGKWCDSWDTAEGAWVVGQRWVRHQANRYLIDQIRGRLNFIQILAAFEQWAQTNNPNESPGGHLVHTRLVESASNGRAVMEVLHDHVSGLKPIPARDSKEIRARAVTPEVESGNVYLPHPGDPGNEWVADLIAELRDFPYAAADDQVDAMTQALRYLRDAAPGKLSSPNAAQAQRQEWQVPRSVTRTAYTDIRASRNIRGPR